MKNNKRAKVLLKVIQKIYDKNPEMQEVIDASIIEVCAKKKYILNRYFLICFLFGVVYIIMPILEKESDEDIKRSLQKF